MVSKATRDGIITCISGPFESISGYKKDELLGKSHNIISHPNIDKNKFKEMRKKIKLKKNKKEQM
ncbi:PAS domain S-box protein [Aliarcobacter butzleri]